MRAIAFAIVFARLFTSADLWAGLDLKSLDRSTRAGVSLYAWTLAMSAVGLVACLIGGW